MRDWHIWQLAHRRNRQCPKKEIWDWKSRRRSSKKQEEEQQAEARSTKRKRRWRRGSILCSFLRGILLIVNRVARKLGAQQLRLLVCSHTVSPLQRKQKSNLVFEEKTVTDMCYALCVVTCIIQSQLWCLLNELMQLRILTTTVTELLTFKLLLSSVTVSKSGVRFSKWERSTPRVAFFRSGLLRTALAITEVLLPMFNFCSTSLLLRSPAILAFYRST